MADNTETAPENENAETETTETTTETNVETATEETTPAEITETAPTESAPSETASTETALSETVPVKGSGASEQGTPEVPSIDRSNPLALGYALADIASGKITITM